MKKNLLAAFAILILGLTPIVATVPAYAATPTNTTAHQNFFDGLIQFLAQKFGLDQNQVKAAVTDYQNQHKQQMQQNMQNREKTRLDALVQQGKITTAQEQAIIDELAKLRPDASSFKDMTAQQRRDAMQKQKNEFDAWAKSQGIDPTLIMPTIGGKRGMGMMSKRDWHKGLGNPTVTPTPAQ